MRRLPVLFAVLGCAISLLFLSLAGVPQQRIDPQQTENDPQPELKLPLEKEFSLDSLRQESDPIADDFILLKPVVQFSCAGFATPIEDRYETEMKVAPDQQRLKALARLVELNAPSSVPLQYQTFIELKNKFNDHRAISKIKEAFDPIRVKRILESAVKNSKQNPAWCDSIDHRKRLELYWCVRAVGVMQRIECMRLLYSLSESEDLYTCLAAEKSVEEFDGQVAEDALLHIVKCWKYNAYVHAANELIRRNPDRFSTELEQMIPPQDCQSDYGLFLGRCRNPKAVPHLCVTVSKLDLVDQEMFRLIANLGQASHQNLILSLPEKVRPDQMEMASEAIARYRQRLKQVMAH